MASEGTSAAAMPAPLAEAVNNFTLHLYKTMLEKNKPENMFFSPFSIISALAMTYAGAKGKTAEEMKAVLKLDKLEDSEIHRSFSEMNDLINTKEGKAYILNVANKLFSRKDYKFLDTFMEATKKHYQAEAESVDFAGDTEGCRQKINSWVEEKTADKIKELIQPGVLDHTTAMVLVNAIYFKGDWDRKFDPKDTRKYLYRITDDDTMEVDMMYQEGKFNFGYSYDLSCKSIELPYINKDISMVVIAPDRDATLQSIEAQLTLENLKPLLDDMHETNNVMTYIPRFKVEHQANLKSMLSAMGMNDAFAQGGADFSGMDGGRQMYLSEVVHKAFVEVNEEGSEAAAATAPMMMLMCMPPEFRADRPFMFLIRDNRTKCILFMGRVVRPESP